MNFYLPLISKAYKYILSFKYLILPRISVLFVFTFRTANSHHFSKYRQMISIRIEFSYTVWKDSSFKFEIFLRIVYLLSGKYISQINDVYKSTQ